MLNLENNDIELELSLYDSTGHLRDTARVEMPARGRVGRLRVVDAPGQLHW